MLNSSNASTARTPDPGIGCNAVVITAPPLINIFTRAFLCLPKRATPSKRHQISRTSACFSTAITLIFCSTITTKTMLLSNITDHLQTGISKKASLIHHRGAPLAQLARAFGWSGRAGLQGGCHFVVSAGGF